MLHLRKRKHDREVKIMFSYFYNGYRGRFILWEFVILWRKIFLISVAIMLANSTSTLQILTAIALILVCLLLQTIFCPFTYKDLNRLEEMCLGVILLTLVAALFYITEARESETALVILFVILVGSNGFFILVWLLKYLD
jgi:hypothetical protein